MDGWDVIDELIDQWVWVRYMTRKLAGSHLLRLTMPQVPLAEEVDYVNQGLLDRRGESWLTSPDNPNTRKEHA